METVQRFRFHIELIESKIETNYRFHYSATIIPVYYLTRIDIKNGTTREPSLRRIIDSSWHLSGIFGRAYRVTVQTDCRHLLSTVIVQSVLQISLY